MTPHLFLEAPEHIVHHVFELLEVFSRLILVSFKHTCFQQGKEVNCLPKNLQFERAAE